MMLAKEVKINNLMRQRKFIEKMLGIASKNRTGDPSYYYIGQIFPENMHYFGKQGYKISRICSSKDLRVTMGKYINVFNVSDDITLTEEEMKVAEAEIVDCDEGDEGDELKKLVELLSKDPSEMDKDSVGRAMVDFMFGTH